MIKVVVLIFTALFITVANCELQPEAIKKHALDIDKIVVGEINSKKLKLPKDVSDATFIRRIYYDVVGRPPTHDEYMEFIGAEGSVETRNRDRGALIKKLLNSEGYVHHMYNFWADLLRVKRNLNENVGNLYGDSYIEWIKGQIRSNTPYDQLTKKLLGAKGNIWQNPETGYLLRDIGMPLDNLSNTTQIFLGVDMACAQCHDHPFDEWSQKDFYESAAFFAQIQTKNSQEGVKGKIKELRDEAKEIQKKGERGVEGKLNRYLRTIYEYGVDYKPNGRLKLPDDYAYRDADPSSVVFAATPYGDRVKESKNKTKRVKHPNTIRTSFVDWVVARDNPTFALNIVNRLWGHAFGAPIIEPMNNVMEDGDINYGKSQRLVEYLSEMLRDMNYDVKTFLEVVYNSRAYQKESWQGSINDYVFQGPLSRRLTASQLWDTYVTLYTGNPDDIKPTYSNELYKKMSLKDVTELTLNDALTELDKFNSLQKTTYKNLPKMGPWYAVRASHVNRPSNNLNVLIEFGRSDRRLVDNGSSEGSVTQLLLLMNSPLVSALSSYNSQLIKKVNTQDNDTVKLYTLFYSIIGRSPTAEDFNLFKPYIEKKQYQDVIWALVNSHEAKFIN
tara:strand:+ start:678 stop:2522 length:1845 start_codon:yes stop_codon:yes gene_type:complete